MYCECGCGQKTAVPKWNHKARGLIAGVPKRFVSGHNGKMKPEEKFWKRAQKSEGCWLWTGVKSKHGYGRMDIRGPYKWAHRASWIINRGPIPEKMCILHKCDNPSCVNPDHLQLGTMADNTLDMLKKGRNKHTLSPDDVRELLRLRKEGMKFIDLSRKFGVSIGHIGHVVSGDCWSWLD